MAVYGQVIALDYTPSLTDWADHFARLPGFVYLDSGSGQTATEMEIVAALPTTNHRLQNYSGNLNNWMTAIEADIEKGVVGCDIIGSSATFTGCVAIGVLDYDSAAERLTGQARNPPHSTAGIFHWLLVTHRETATTEILFHPDCPDPIRRQVCTVVDSKQPLEPQSYRLSAGFQTSISKPQYQSHIERIQEYILAGDCYQVNYAQRFETELRGDAWSAYRATREKLAGGFSGFVRTASDHAILSLSPERFLRIQQGVVTTQPIKGTAPRHANPTLDAELAESLVNSEKDRAENVMITDLLRNDIGQFCETGTVTVTELCGLHSFGNVHHLISTVEGHLAPHVSAGQMLLATSPGGSITGAPKKRAMEIIAELEPYPRGAYCGSLFVLAGHDWLQSSIAIRTLEAKGNTLHCWGGGGITASSHWEAEYQETIDKVGPIMATLEAADQCSGNSIPS